MVQALGIRKKRSFVAAVLLLLGAWQAYAQEDPPARVARLNHIEGNVSMEPAGLDEWAPAVINHPFTTGDYLYTDGGARAELHLDEAVLRMGAQTSFGFLNLNDEAVQIKLSEGDMYFRLHDLAPNQIFEVDTPNAAVTLLREGVYRFRIDPNGSMSFVVVRSGEAEITGGGQAFTLNPGNSAMITGTDQLAMDVEAAPLPDNFDNWSSGRDAHEERLASAQYLPPTVIGYEDLDDYGSWQETGDYGPVWYPRTVAAGWAPYQAGHWVWVEPWGWTWVDDAPWGFAPFHYGRWAFVSGRWGWCPGPIAIGRRGPVVRPYYAPALVAWLGGAHWGVSIAGGRPDVGWIALGFGEVFTPSYVCSRRYFTNVNVYNTRVAPAVNITNVYERVYVNHAGYEREFANARAPGAVGAMRRDGFASGRPVRESRVEFRAADLAQLRTSAVIAPGIAPTRQSLAATMGRPAARPAAQVLAREVVARHAPPPGLASFTARERFLAQHAGQPLNEQAMHQSVGGRPAAAALVRQAQPVNPVPVHPGERFGGPRAAHEPTAVPPRSGATVPEGRFAERTQPAPRAEERRPVSTERTQPAPRVEERRPVSTERTQSAPRAEERRPVSTERTQPAPRAEERRPVSTERTQPAPAAGAEHRPSAAAHEEHRTPEARRDDHKDHGK